ncbi:MAG: nuclear transport factor 2 family protein [Planctomycetota bacterium]|jgi:hypothetical protein
MPIRFQCSYCLNKLSAEESFAGRRIACPMCETALEVPEPGEPPPFMIENLADALERYKITDFDHACAKEVIRLGLVPTRKLGSAIAKLREEMMRGRSPTLLAILRRYGRIDERGEREIRAGVDVPEPSRGPSGTPSRPKREHRDSLRILKQTVVLDIEAHEIAKGPVPAVPGPGLNRCPNCGRTVKDGAAREGKCPVCSADVRAVVAQPPSGRSLRSTVAWLARNWLALGGIAAAIVLAWAGLNWSRVRRMGAGFLKGEPRAALEERVRRFDRALEFGDTEALGELLAPECGRAGAGLRAFILSGAEPPPPIEKVLSIEHPEIDLDEHADRATVYTRVRAKLDLTKVKTREIESSADVAAAGRVMIGAGGGLSAELAWKWVRVDGRWFYRGPIPATRE